MSCEDRLTREQEVIAHKIAAEVQRRCQCGYVRYTFNQYSCNTGPAYSWKLDMGPVTLEVDGPHDMPAQAIVEAAYKQIENSASLQYWTGRDRSISSTGEGTYFDEN